MSRRSLRPQLNQIRGWVRQGRTDAWIAHQLEVTVQQIQAFKREHGLEPEESEAGDGSSSYEEVDLRAEDDAAIAAELEAEEARREEERKAEEARQAEEDARKAEEEAKAAEEAARKAAESEDEEPEEKPKRRTRARSGGRTRKRGAAARPLEGTFDHGEEGYGLWLDPAVQDDPVYAEHWAGHRPVEVTIEEDQIVIRRSGSDDEDDDG
jgi:hypothetical protein